MPKFFFACALLSAFVFSGPRELRAGPAILQQTQGLCNGQDNHATMLTLEGKLDRKMLCRALEMAFHVHPNLRVKTIAYDAENDRHIADGERDFSSIPCHFYKGGDVRAFLRDKLSNPFPKEGPYWHVYCFSEGEGLHHVIQCFDHSLVDGVSTAALQDEVLSYYSALLEGKEPQLVVDERVNVESVRTFEEHLQLGAEIAKEYPPTTQTFPYETVVPIEERTTNAVLLAFPVRELCVRSKKEGRTVNEVLCAAALLALRDIREAPSVETGVLTCVSHRKPKPERQFTERNLDDLLGVIVHPQRVEADDTIDTVAQSYKDLLRAHWELGKPFDGFSAIDLVRFYGIDQVHARDFYPVGLATSNLGKIGLQKHYGDLRVTSYQFFSSQVAAFFEVLLNVSTVEDTAFCNFTYVEPLHSRRWMLDFATLWVDHLKEYGVTPLEEGTDADLLERM